MQEKPVLPEEQITAALWEAYGLKIGQLEFLPVGADINTAVYRLVSRDAQSYFLKLRNGLFDETSVLVPRFLHDHHIRQIIPPLKTKDNRLWAQLEPYTCTLYRYIEGQDGFDRPLSKNQWINFGSALQAVHALVLPPDLKGRIPSETFSSRWRSTVIDFQTQVENNSFEEPLAAKMAALIRSKRQEIRLLIERAEKLASLLRFQPLDQVLCHSDIHAGNLLVTTAGPLYMVDWDNPIMAPKERDLMFIGGGIGGIWNSPKEETLFYQGYGPTALNWMALAYYRYERIVQDIAAYCEQILLSQGGSEDREQGFQDFSSQFWPGRVVEIAHQTYRKLAEGS